jgi:RNA polymerase primary sigma factor
VRAVGSKEIHIMIATAVHDRRRVDSAHASMPRDSGRPGLSRDEEIELAARVARGDHQARNRMVQANLSLVGTIAREFRHRGLSLEDLIGEGNLGLIRAAEEFDPRFGARFSTYASYWIKQAIRHALINTTSTIRLPARMVGLLTKWRRAERSLHRELRRAPSFEEIATSLGLSEAQKTLVATAHRARQLKPGSGLAGAANQWWPEESIDRREAPDSALEAEDERALLLSRLHRLDDRERTVLSLRYGLEGAPRQRLKEICRRLGVSKQWVRKLELRALRKLGEGQTVKAAGACRRGDQFKARGSAIA